MGWGGVEAGLGDHCHVTVPTEPSMIVGKALLLSYCPQISVPLSVHLYDSGDGTGRGSSPIHLLPP